MNPRWDSAIATNPGPTPPNQALNMMAQRNSDTSIFQMEWRHARDGQRGRNGKDRKSVACERRRLAPPEKMTLDWPHLLRHRRLHGELEGGAGTVIRDGPESSAMLFDDRTADREAHSDAFRLRRKEWLKNAVCHLRLYS